jgi:hypothetical protein
MQMTGELFVLISFLGFFRCGAYGFVLHLWPVVFLTCFLNNYIIYL